MIPYGLQTEQRTEPLGLDDPRPRLSWKLRSDRHGAAQSAYRITATAGGETVWDTGRRESADTILIPWEGAGLRSATRYRWRVEVWDEAGTATAAETWFETGLLHREDWTAVWIGRDPVALPPVDPPPPASSTSCTWAATGSVTGNWHPAGPNTTTGRPADGPVRRRASWCVRPAPGRRRGP
jgi:hypothetical protein